MKISYNTLSKNYLVEGVKTFKEEGQVNSSRIKIRIEPGSPSVFTNFQKIKFSREIISSKKELPVFDSFIRDSAKILGKYELELDSKGVPYKIVKHKDIWKQWLYYADVLHSKYSGEWVEKQIGLITHRIADKDIFLETLMDDFIMNELFARDIYRIKFDDKINVCNRTWPESGLGILMNFNQECKVKISSKEDRLYIKGFVDLPKYKKLLNGYFKDKKYQFEDIESITQDTVYYSNDISCIPYRIESKFLINGHDKPYKEISIRLNIEEV